MVFDQRGGGPPYGGLVQFPLEVWSGGPPPHVRSNTKLPNCFPFLFKGFLKSDKAISWTTTLPTSQTIKALSDNQGYKFLVCNLILTQLDAVLPKGLPYRDKVCWQTILKRSAQAVEVCQNRVEFEI